MQFDVIVIGSGFGGAITSCRLQEKGYEVLVLERGRRWDKTNFPRDPKDPWNWDGESPEHRNGWLELRHFPNMTVAAGAAVGGGSLIYANISCEAPAARFDHGWPPEITYAELKPHYDSVKRFMAVREVPDSQWTRRMQLMKEAAEKTGTSAKFRKLELAVSFDEQWTYEKDFSAGKAASRTFVNEQGAEQGTCVHLGNCDIGCDVHAKNTLDRNYLFWAEKKGADLRPLHLVTNIEVIQGGYEVHYDELKNGQRIPGSATARLVIVAAGSLGSTELLLRCKEITRSLPSLSDFLGRNWSSNGDFLTPAFHPHREVDASRGPTIAAAIDLYENAADAEFWVQDGGFPNLLEGYLEHKRADPSIGFKAKLLVEFIDGLLKADSESTFDKVMPWFAQGLDAANGRLTIGPRSWVDRRPRLNLEWDVRRSRDLIDRIVAMHERLARETGGKAVVPPTWSLFKDLITPHPLGGCNMGTDASSGVVDHRGEVFGYPGLYVADGAIIPKAIGVNPSRTIGALAERTASLLATAGR